MGLVWLWLLNKILGCEELWELVDDECEEIHEKYEVKCAVNVDVDKLQDALAEVLNTAQVLILYRFPSVVFSWQFHNY